MIQRAGRERPGSGVLAVLTGIMLSVVGREAFAATQYYVRTNGNDACNGTSSSGGSSGTCAWRTVQYAVDHINCGQGDDIDIGTGTFSEAVVIPTGCRCPGGGNDCVITGQGSASTDVDPGSGVAAITLGSTSSGSPSDHITIQDLHLIGGTNANVACDAAGAARYCQHITLQDLLLDGLGQQTRHANPLDAAILFPWGISTSGPNYDGIVVDGVTIEGDDGNCIGSSGLYRACGSDTNATFMTNYGPIIKNSTVRNILGYITRMGPHGRLVNNHFEHVWGDTDDGLVQAYNESDQIVYGNMFFHCNPINQAFAVVRFRRTGENECCSPNTTPPTACSGHPPATCGKLTSGEIMNNTFIAEPTNCTGSGCTTPGTEDTVDGRKGGAYNQSQSRVAIAMVPSSSMTIGPYPYLHVVHNIIQGFTSGTAVYIADNSGHQGIGTGTCPTDLTLSGNIYWNNGDNISRASCSADTFSYDVTETSVDPGLDSSGAPDDSLSPACIPGGFGHTSVWDSNYATHVYAGSAQGDCLDTVPVCGNDDREGFEDCDGDDLDGADCGSFGFSGGTLACTADCKFDDSSCTVTPVQVQTTTCAAVNHVLTCNFANAPQSGNALVLCSARRATTSEDITGIALDGTTWAQVGSVVINGNGRLQMYYATNIAPAGDTSLVVTYGTNNNRPSVVEVSEYRGLRLTGALDTDSATSTGSSSTPASGTISSGSFDQANNVLAGCLSRVEAAPTYSNETSGYTERADVGSNSQVSMAMYDRIISAAANSSVSATATSSGSWTGRIAAFKTPAQGSFDSAPFCTNHIVEPGNGEGCDLDDLGGETCVSLVCSGGTLACASDCTFDKSACTNCCSALFVTDFCSDVGSRCTATETCGADGCHYYSCAYDPSCLAPDDCPVSACTCPQ
jgi:hypothetical protein